MHIYIDESGQLSFNSKEHFFVVAGFSTYNQKEIQKKMKIWFQTKFPKKIRMQSEIKWTDRIDDDLRIKTLMFMKKLDITIIFKFITKEILIKQYSTHRRFDPSKIYIDLLLEVLLNCNLNNNNFIYIRCDRRPMKNVTSQEFTEIIRKDLYEIVKLSTIIDVEMIDSTTSMGIQIADWIAGSIIRYLEKGYQWKEIGAVLELDN